MTTVNYNAEMSYVSGPAATEQNPPHPSQATIKSSNYRHRGFFNDTAQLCHAENTSLRIAFGEAFTPGIYSSQVEGQIFMQHSSVLHSALVLTTQTGQFIGLVLLKIFPVFMHATFS